MGVDVTRQRGVGQGEPGEVEEEAQLSAQSVQHLVGVAASRMPAAAVRTVPSRSAASPGSSVTTSTPAPGTLRMPLHTASTAPGSSGSSTTNSSMATPAPRSRTSSPTTLPAAAPISAATAPSTPGASGSQIRMRVSTPFARRRQVQWVLVMRTTTRMRFSALPA